MEHQQDIAYQMDLFIEQNRNAVRPSDNCEDVNGAKAGQAGQIDKEGQQGRALTKELMTIVCSSDNLKQAYKRVKRNKGVAGIDQMPTGMFAEWFINEGKSLINDLLQGNYQPQETKQVEIPKPKGGMRKLGIPTVRGQDNSTSYCTSIKSNLRARVFRKKLWLSTKTQCPTGTTSGKRIRNRGKKSGS